MENDTATETDDKYECRGCGETFTFDEINPDSEIIGTCPDCGSHRFRSGDRR